MKLDMSGGVSNDAKHFLEGFQKAYTAGMAVEYTEMFLDVFAESYSSRAAEDAKNVALDEWGI